MQMFGLTPTFDRVMFKEVAVLVSSLISIPLSIYIAFKLKGKYETHPEGDTEEFDVIERVLMFPDGGYQCMHWTKGCEFYYFN